MLKQKVKYKKKFFSRKPLGTGGNRDGSLWTISDLLVTVRLNNTHTHTEKNLKYMVVLVNEFKNPHEKYILTKHNNVAFSVELHNNRSKDVINNPVMM